VRTECGETDVGRWETASRRPHPRLRHYVIGYVGLKSTLRLTGERHLPSGEAGLVLNLGTPHEVIGPAEQSGTMMFHSVAAMGVHNRPFVTKGANTKHLLVVRLTPPGAHALFGVPMDLLLNRWVDLNQIDRSLTRRIEEQAGELSRWEDLFDFFDSVIGQRVDATLGSASAVSWAWNQFRFFGGLGKVGSLADRLDWSHKRLLHEFRKHVGLLPKQTAEIARFNRVLRLMRGGKGINWAGVAQECGYYDQPHMIREFERFAGDSPNGIEALRAGFTLRDRAVRAF